MAVAIDQHHGFKPFNRSQRCRLQSYTHFDFNNVLDLNQSNLAHSLKQAFANIHRSVSTPCFTNGVEEEIDTSPKVEIVGGHGAPRVRAFVVEVAIAMASGVDPVPVSSGLGGAYFLRNRNGDNFAVAKPIDEEPLAVNNLKGFGGLMLSQPGIKGSVRVGEGGFREVAAYLLDHGAFAGVPPTALVRISHVGFHGSHSPTLSAMPHKIASLQGFVDHDFDAGELGPSGFSVSAVHRIGILDIRLLNLDRHAGNILVKKNDQHGNYAVGAAELVPIDHGLCLPERLDDPYFEWLYWPQALIPFSESEIEYISNLDPHQDTELLRREIPSLRESSIRVLVLCTIFLKRAAAAGLCLADIGKMMTREYCGGEENFSPLEKLCMEAKASVLNVSKDCDDNGSIELRREEKGGFDIFQFDDESLDACSEVVNLPQLLQCPPMITKPPKIPKFSSVKSMPGLHDASLSPLYESNDYEDEGIFDGNDDAETIRDGDSEKNSGDGVKGVTLTRSISYSVRNYNRESEGVTVGDMSETDWELFLDCFEKLLPDVLEVAKSTCLKQRLGTSCEF